MSASHQSLATGEIVPASLYPITDLAALSSPHFEIVDGQVLLRGSVSASSHSKAFPRREVCMETGARDMQDMLFGPFGTLYSFATVHVSSSRPVPYTIGYVDFPNGVRALAEIRASSDDALKCDLAVEVRSENDNWFVVPSLDTTAGKESA